MEVPLGIEVTRMPWHPIHESGKKDHRASGGVGETPVPAEVVDELDHPRQTLEIEQMRSRTGRKGSGRVESQVRRAEGNGGVAAIGQTHDDVGALTAADADNG
jgi:hypothetical protein